MNSGRKVRKRPPLLLKSQTASQPTIEVLFPQQERREQFKRGRFRAIAIEKAKPQTPKADSALPQEQISQSQLIKTRQQSLKRQHFIREAVRRHFQRQAEQRAATSITAPMRIESPTLPGMTTPKKGCCHPIASPVSLPDERYQAAVGPHGLENCRNAGGSARCWWGGVDVGYGS